MFRIISKGVTSLKQVQTQSEGQIIRLSELTSPQQVRWCKTALYRSVIHTERRYREWMGHENAPLDDTQLNVMDHPQRPWLCSTEHFDLEAAIGHLSLRERALIKGLWQEGMTQREIARHWGVSQPLVNRWHRRAISKLRQLLTDESLPDHRIAKCHQ